MSSPLQIPVCIDGRMLKSGGTGVSTFSRVLLHAQALVADRPHILRASPSGLPPAIGSLCSRARKARLIERRGQDIDEFVVTDVFRRAHVHFGLYGALTPVVPPLPFGIMHWTYPVPLFFKGWINIYSVHDIIPITQPQLSSVSGERLARTLKAIAEVADSITTISNISREDIIGLGLFSPDIIVNTSLTIDLPAEQAIAPSREAILTQAGLKFKGYLLFSGSIEARKNIQMLLSAYRTAGVDMPLVIVGPETRDGQFIESDIRATPGVIRLPYQSTKALDALIWGARGLLFPSLAEGFGLPVLEAMAKRTAVMASHIPAISEVAGDAALLIDPQDTGKMAEAIKKLAGDANFALTLAHSGVIRARLFSMKRFSASILAVYQMALAGRSNSQGSF